MHLRRYVGPRPSFIARSLREPEEHACANSAISDRWLGHNDGDGRKPRRFSRKVAEVELTMLQI